MEGKAEQGRLFQRVKILLWQGRSTTKRNWISHHEITSLCLIALLLFTGKNTWFIRCHEWQSWLFLQKPRTSIYYYSG
jgi:hypothetical protein